MRMLKLAADSRRGLVCANAVVLLFGFAWGARAGDAGSAAPINPTQCEEMRAHNVMRADAPVGCGRLSLVSFPYVGFDGKDHGDGRIVVMDAVADYVLQIFMKLHEM